MQNLTPKQIAYGLIILGIAAVAISILIDPLRGYDIHLAAIQIVVLVAGIVVALVGAYLAFVRKEGPAA